MVGVKYKGRLRMVPDYLHNADVIEDKFNGLSR